MFETVEDLTNAVTAVLSPDGPLGTLAKTLTDALDTVWAEFFASPAPPNATNWNAYSHERLHAMLWEGADVGDVGTVAAEWGRHSAALTEYADVLRREGDALRANWQGRAAELAADRLAELSDRIWNAGARAGTVQKAAGNAGEALAIARNTMPPPTPDPLTLLTSAVGAGPLPPLNAVLIGAARIFTADAVAGVSKAEAVRVMQRYETTLRNSGDQVVPSRPEAPTTRSYQVDGLSGAATTTAGFGATSASSAGGAGGGRGESWSRLVGGGALGAGKLTGAGPVAVGGGRAGGGGAPAEAAAARRAMPAGGFMGPGMMPPRGDDERDKPHQTRLPTVDNGIFALDERTSSSVIGGPTEREHDGGL